MTRVRGRATWTAAAFAALAGVVLLAIAANGLLVRRLSVEQQGLLDEALVTFDGAWVATGSTAGGYSLYSSSVPSSLYSTSWTIQLLGRAGAIPSTLEPESVQKLMLAAIANPADHGVPALEAIWLALRALDVLGVELPTQSVVSMLTSYLTEDGRYAWEPGGEPSWGATSTAARVLGLVAASPPTATVERIRDALSEQSTPASIEELSGDLIPIWEAADELLTDNERLPFRSKVDEIVRYFDEWVDANCGYAGGQILGAVVALEDIAKRNAATAPSVDLPASWTGLATPNGGFGATPGGLVPDPHTTYDALRLGAPLDHSALTYFSARARSDGWATDLTELDPCNTYMGAVVSRAAGDQRHDGALAATAAQWLNELNSQVEVSDSALCILALAEVIGVEPPSALADQLRTASTDSSGNAAAAPLALRVRILRIVGTPGEIPAAFATGIADAPIQDMDGYDACAMVADLAGRSADCALPEALRMPDGTYRQFAAAPVSDLEATVIALQSSGDTSARMNALTQFRDDGHTWIVPAATSPNVHNLHSAFLGLVLADVIRDPRYL